MPSPDVFSPSPKQRAEPPADRDIDYLNHSRALALQQQSTRPEQLHYVLESSRETVSHW